MNCILNKADGYQIDIVLRTWDHLTISDHLNYFFFITFVIVLSPVSLTLLVINLHFKKSHFPKLSSLRHNNSFIRVNVLHICVHGCKKKVFFFMSIKSFHRMCLCTIGVLIIPFSVHQTLQKRRPQKR